MALKMLHLPDSQPGLIVFQKYIQCFLDYPVLDYPVLDYLVVFGGFSKKNVLLFLSGDLVMLFGHG